MHLNIPTAEVFDPLLSPAREKGAYGGRGSGKSHFFADNVVEDSLRYPGLRTVCIREVLRSLKDSAKLLIEDKIERHKVGKQFRVYNDHITTPSRPGAKGGVIIFQGMNDHNAESVKSLENFGRAWCEEAQALTQRSMDLLIPTIRADDSEIWYSWNPRRKADPVDKRLRGDTPPPSSTIVRANWSDNPWFPDVLEQERRYCKETNPEGYPHIWEGDYATVTTGAYWASHLLKAKEEGRIGYVPADPLMTIRLFADIGGTGAKADNFVIWAAQFIGHEIRVLNHYEVQGQALGHHLDWLRSQGYTPEKAQIWLPHDGDTNDKVIDVSYASAFQGAGYEVTVVPNQGRGAASGRIEEARRLFGQMWFNADTTEAGREALGFYHEKIDPARLIGLGPDHDWSSHSADAFGLMSIVYEPPKSSARKLKFRKLG